MGRIVGQGAELLHSLWAHAERAVLRGRPPPPTLYRGGRASVERALRTTNPTTYGGKAVVDAHVSPVTKAVLKTLKNFTGDAFTTVFVRVRQPNKVDDALAAQFREMMHSKKGSKSLISCRGMAFRSQARQKLHLPSAPSLQASRYGEVGFNPYRKTFTPYSLFSEKLVTHAPLALRAVADELEDEWQKYHHKRARAASRAGMRNSTRRSGYLMDRFAVHKMKPVEVIPTEVQNVITALQTNAATNKASSTTVVQEPEQEAYSLETSIQDAFSFPRALEQPYIVTRLLVPLCPDLELLLAPQSNTSDLDSLSRSAFLHDVSNVVDSFERHRLKRIVTIERAFDQAPLRPYRPREWDESMLIELYQGTQDIRQVCLTIDFPNLTAIEVKQLLAQSMSYESARWYSTFLYEVRRDASLFGDSDTGSWTGVESPPTSSMVSDVGRDIDEMGAASLLSMEDQHNSIYAHHHPPDLQFPFLEIDASTSSPL